MRKKMSMDYYGGKTKGLHATPLSVIIRVIRVLAFIALSLTGCDQPVNSDHEDRLTGTDRFTFEAINNNTSYRVSKGTAITGKVVIPGFYRPDEGSDFLPVTSIGDRAFINCTGLTGITIPASVASIGEVAFSGCENLTGITLPAGITSISDDAFSGCASLASITLPADVVSIGNRAFRDCKSLASISIPAGVVSIGDLAFSGTAWLNNQPDGLVYVNEVLYAYKGEMPDNTAINNIPEGTIAIAGYAFSGYESLISITLPASVASIGNRAFFNCSNLASITLPAGLASIGANAFDYCIGLASITIPASVTSIGSSAFYQWTSSQTINIEGHANEAAANAAWGSSWQNGCDAVLVTITTKAPALKKGA